MLNPDILPMLRCPATGEALVFADAQMLERVNAAITAGDARDQLDQRVSESVDGGLVNATEDRLYPIRESIPTLISEDAIRLAD